MKWSLYWKTSIELCSIRVHAISFVIQIDSEIKRINENIDDGADCWIQICPHGKRGFVYVCVCVREFTYADTLSCIFTKKSYSRQWRIQDFPLEGAPAGCAPWILKGGGQPRRWGHWLLTHLCLVKFVCQNEGIGTLQWQKLLTSK